MPMNLQAKSEQVNGERLYKMSQEERSIFWKLIISVILSKNVDMYMCSIPNGFRDRAI
jgi:hypothetical protein